MKIILTVLIIMINYKYIVIAGRCTKSENDLKTKFSRTQQKKIFKIWKKGPINAYTHTIDWIVEICIKHVSLYKTINKQKVYIHYIYIYIDTF